MDRWILELIRTGYSVLFEYLASSNSPSLFLLGSLSHKNLLKNEVLALLKMGAVEEVPGRFKVHRILCKVFHNPQERWRPLTDSRP